MQKRTREGQNIAVEQIEGILKGAPERLDGERARSLGTLTSVKRAKLIQSRRERARLEARYGREDPRVLKADQRMRRQHHQLVNTRAECDRAGAPLVERDDNTWKVHGFVRNQEGQPVGDATVALFPDREGQQDALTETKTNTKGYFSFSYAPPFATATRAGGGEPQSELALLGDDGEAGGRGLRINTNLKRRRIRQAAAAIKQPVFLGAKSGVNEAVDSRILYPTPGSIIYRDIELKAEDTDACGLRTRYLGNSHTRELHDLNREKPGCQIAKMRPDHRVYLSGEQQAQAMDYDFCAHCFGAAKSRR